MFDVAIVGAGICGCSAAHFLGREGLRVALIERESIAAGGSGAAGAFIAPKISKSGPLKTLSDAAHRFSYDFYRREHADLFLDRPLLHIAKYEDDNAKVAAFKASTMLHTGDAPEALRNLLTPFADSFDSVYLRESGVVDAAALCERLASGAERFAFEASDFRFESGCWHIGSVRARRVVLATGAYRSVVDLPYIALRGVWGHRIDVRCEAEVPEVVHHLLSVSPTRPDGLTALGATHDVHYHPERNTEPYDPETGRAELIEKACKSVRLGRVEVVRDFTGLRSGSNDYLPICGPLPDARASLKAEPGLLNGEPVEEGALVHFPGLYMLNGTGGYGFVLGPYLGKRLAGMIAHGKSDDDGLLPSRFLRRWAKRSPEAAGYAER